MRDWKENSNTTGKNKKLKIIFFDVGLGDCILAECGGKHLLIDGGIVYSDLLKLYIKSNNIKKIDHVICTHAHEDHVEGLAEILHEIEYGDVYCNINSFPNSNGFTKISEKVKADGKDIIIPSVNDSIELEASRLVFLGPKDVSGYEMGNDCSLITKLIFGERSIIFLGDAFGKGALDLLDREVNVSADIIKIPHHGLSKLPPELLDRISPTKAVISYAPNTYNNLSYDLQRQLNERKIEVWRTDRDGSIQCEVYDNDVHMSRLCEEEETLIGKKLLILGANMETIPIIEKAKEMGVVTYVADYDVLAPGKEVAGHRVDIDGKDVKRLVEFVLENSIDGVLLGVADPLTEAYVSVCGKTNLPCLVDRNNVSNFTNKERFRKMLADSGIDTVPQYYIGDDYHEAEKLDIVYPVVVKPCIGRGGKGVFLCRKKKELIEFFPKAVEHSDNQKAIIEKYMTCPDMVASYVIKDGSSKLLYLSDHATLKKEKEISSVTYGNYFPSVVEKEYMEKMDLKIRKMLWKHRVYNGLFTFQMFFKDGVFYPYDPNCIIDGELSGPIAKDVYDVDVIEESIRYTLCGRWMSGFMRDEISIRRRQEACSIWILLKPGKIKRIEGIETLEKLGQIAGMVWRKREGDVIKGEEYQTEKSSLARIWIKADTLVELNDVEQKIRNSIRVFDENGEDMVIRDGDVISIRKW